jgi:hypothetical protein
MRGSLRWRRGIFRTETRVACLDVLKIPTNVRLKTTDRLAAIMHHVIDRR